MSKSTKGKTTQFFWDRKTDKNRSRFNLLLLEYGEYLLEDLSAYYFPIPTHDLSTAFEVKDALKVQGRLKLLTRSLMFEPAELSSPVYRFPYKSMNGQLEQFHLKESEKRCLSVDVSGFLTFTVQSVIEMKENNKVGPYKLIDHAGSGGHRSVFALVHADLQQFLAKVEQLRNIFTVSIRQGSGAGTQLLKPFIEAAQLWTLQFDTSHLVNFHEKMMFNKPLAAQKIKPLTINPGSLMITDSRVYFQPSQLNNIGDSVLHFEVRHIARVFQRRYLLQQTGLEFILADSSSHLFVLDSQSVRDMAYGLLLNLRALSPQARGQLPVPAGSSLDSAGREARLEELCGRWQRGELNNFDYLMALNTEADRSVNDLTQYPVFPHILADYSSRKLDLDAPATFRDLSKPVGALNPDRLQYFKQRFHSMPPADAAMGLPPPFLYGTHYSTPGYVLHYLVRVAPEYMLCLQNGKFDAPDRMFHSLESTWQSCLTNPTDLKELIPEFFTGSGEFLVNYEDLDLGHLHTGERLADVTLPPWADSPRDFIRKHAKALESEHVSQHLHEWIDLIFGHKQQGQAAIDADNVYYYLTYEGAVDLDKVSDIRQKDALILQIQEFGQTPKQLFHQPHPSRRARPSSKAPPASVLSEGADGAGTTSSRRSPLDAQAGSEGSERGRAGSSEVVVKEPLPPGQEGLLPSVQVPVGQERAVEEDGDEAEASVGVRLLHLDEAFRREVEQELRNESGDRSTSPPLSVPAPPPPLPTGKSRGVGASSQQRNASGDSLGSSPSHAAAHKQYAQPRERRPTETLLNTVLSWTFGSPAPSQRPPATPLTERSLDAARSPSSPSPTSQLGPTCSNGISNSNIGSDATVGSSALSLMGPTPANPNPAAPDPRKIVMLGSDAFYWHSKAVTNVCAMLYPDAAQVSTAAGSQSRGSGAARFGTGAVTEVTHSLIASVSRDANLKVTRAEQVLTGEFVRDSFRTGLGAGTSSMGPKQSLQVSVLQTNVSPRRTNSVSASSLSSVLLLPDTNHVLFTSWDNNIYGYSVSHAHTVSKTYAHDDAITCMAACEGKRHVLTGSLDASVKLWEVRDPAAALSAAGTDAASIISPKPLLDLCDMTSAVVSVALHWGARLAAAGSDDGTLTLWEATEGRLLCSVPTNAARRPVRCLLWVAAAGLASSGPTLLCGTEDGWLLQFSPGGQQLAALKLERSGAATAKPSASGQRSGSDVHARCLQWDGRALYGGCSDGSLRCWLLSSGAIEEVYRHTDAHAGPVSTLSIAVTPLNSAHSASAELGSHNPSRGYSAMRHTLVMVSGGEDCAVRVWRVYCSGDY